MERAPEQLDFGVARQAVPLEVGEAVAAPPPEVEQREDVAHVTDVGVARPADLIDGDPDRDVGDDTGRHPPRVRVAEPAPDLGLDRFDLVLGGAYLHFTRSSDGGTVVPGVNGVPGHQDGLG